MMVWLDQPEENPGPEVIASQWQLAMDGMVQNWLNLTLDDLKAHPH